MGEGDQACGACVGSALVPGLREVLACCCLGLLNGQNGPAKEGVLGLCAARPDKALCCRGASLGQKAVGPMGLDLEPNKNQK